MVEPKLKVVETITVSDDESDSKLDGEHNIADDVTDRITKNNRKRQSNLQKLLQLQADKGALLLKKAAKKQKGKQGEP